MFKGRQFDQLVILLCVRWYLERIGVSSAIRWIARSKIGELAPPRQQGRRCGSRLDEYAGFITGIIEVCPDITLNEMVARLEAGSRCASAGAP